MTEAESELLDGQQERREETVRDRLEAARRDAPKRGLLWAVIAVIIVVALIAAAWGLGLFGRASSETIALTGAGASFPFPLISKWIQVYESETGVRVSYESIGSSGGIGRIEARLVDFGGTDAPLTPDKDNLGLVHIPETIGAVACVYNVPGIATGLRLTGDVLAGIFMRGITSWNDVRIAELNPTLDLPGTDITVVRRSDGSGTTFVFTSYLSKVNGTWEELYGADKSIDWAEGTIGASGNAGVSGVVTTTPNSIGYVELAYAIENDMDIVALRNSEGNFILPSLASTAAAADAAAPSLPPGDESWYGVEIVDAPGADSYPIATFTYLLIYKEQTDADRGRALVEFLWWIIHDGQQYSESLSYVPLSAQVVALNEQTLRGITHNGVSLLHE